MTFGVTETIRCLQDLKEPGPKGETLCLSNKFTVIHFIGPVGLSDDGYVLGIKNTNSYYPLSKTLIAELQTSGALPNPMPSYTISKGDYLYGYLLWLILAVMLLFALAKSWKARRYRAVFNKQEPIGTSSPIIETEGDRFIADQLALLLRSRERVSHQAFARSNVVENALISLGGTAHFVALTDQRLILIDTRPALFGVRLENHGVESIDRSAVEGVQLGANGVLRILLKEGKPRILAIDPKQRRFSNQVAFLRDVPGLFPLAPKPADVLPAPASGQQR